MTEFADPIQSYFLQIKALLAKTVNLESNIIMFESKLISLPYETHNFGT